jgi:hypothetical protein
MAAQAVEDTCPAGESVEIGIISRKQKSPLYGAQYLHHPVFGFTATARPRVVFYRLGGGSALDYRRKVYGEGWTGSVSPEDLPEAHNAWDIRQTYDALWRKWEHAVSDRDITPYTLKQLVDDVKPDMVISTIPRQQLCHGGDRTAHFFNQIEVWAAGDAPDLGIDIGKMYPCEDEVVKLNADPEVAWYRKSRVFGHTTVEWPGWIQRVPVSTASRVPKPLNTNCDCWPDILHVGRYGAWEKGVLSDSAYTKTHARMAELWAQRALF